MLYLNFLRFLLFSRTLSRLTYLLIYTYNNINDEFNWSISIAGYDSISFENIADIITALSGFTGYLCSSIVHLNAV